MCVLILLRFVGYFFGKASLKLWEKYSQFGDFEACNGGPMMNCNPMMNFHLLTMHSSAIWRSPTTTLFAIDPVLFAMWREVHNYYVTTILRLHGRCCLAWPTTNILLHRKKGHEVVEECVYWRLCEIAVMNSYVLHNIVHGKSRKMTQKVFRLQFAYSLTAYLIAQYANPPDNAVVPGPGRNPTSIARLLGKHFLTNAHVRQRCSLCQAQKSEHWRTKRH